LKKGVYDGRWKDFPCRLYVFDKSEEEVENLVTMLGHEDNQSYQRVSTVVNELSLSTRKLHSWRFILVRKEFVNHCARRDAQGKIDELQRWPKVPPPGYKNMMRYRQELVEYVMAIIPEKYSDKKKTANQITHFATRIRPINNLIWNIMKGNYNKKGKKKQKVIEGVSTFCHLQGLSDQEALNVLTLVFNGEINADEMRIKIMKLKQEQRCFNAAMEYLQNQLELKNVRTSLCV
jgi:hypothetical protein